MIAFQSTSYIAPIITLPYLTKTLGPHNFGSLNYCLAIIALLIVITDWGFNLSATRKISTEQNNRTNTAYIFWGTISAKLLIALLTLCALLIAITLFETIRSLSNILLITWLMVIGNVITINWYLQGIEQFGAVATAGILARLLTIPATFIFVSSAEDTWIAALINSLCALLVGLISIIAAYRTRKIQWCTPSLLNMKQQIKDGWDIFVSTLSVSLFTSANTIILGSISGMSQVAIYNAADKIKTALNMPSAQLTNVIYPRVSATFKDQIDSSKKLIKLTIAFNIIATLSTLIFLIYFAQKIVLMIFPENFSGAGEVLIIMFSAYIFGNIAYPLGLLAMLNLGITRARRNIMLLAGVASIPTTYFLSSAYGAIGAAYSLLITEAIILLGFLIALHLNSKSEQSAK